MSRALYAAEEEHPRFPVSGRQHDKDDGRGTEYSVGCSIKRTGGYCCLPADDIRAVVLFEAAAAGENAFLSPFAVVCVPNRDKRYAYAKNKCNVAFAKMCRDLLFCAFSSRCIASSPLTMCCYVRVDTN